MRFPNRPTSFERKADIWIQDQYFNPHETWHSIGEVLHWFEEHLVLHGGGEGLTAAIRRIGAYVNRIEQPLAVRAVRRRCVGRAADGEKSLARRLNRSAVSPAANRSRSSSATKARG